MTGIETFMILFAMAMLMEIIDSGIGMMYGTILSPVLIILGYSPFLVVPSILLSQACGGFTATYFHNHYGNAEFNIKKKDFKIAALIFSLGLVAVIGGAFIGSIMSKTFMKVYIGILCIVMGGLVVSKVQFAFSWMKISVISLLSAFNKALSGGGFGPIIATGQIASGVDSKRAIGITDFAEAPICLASFISWMAFNGFETLSAFFLVPLCLGAIFGGSIGPRVLYYVKDKKVLTICIGVLSIASGLWMLWRVLL